MPDTPKKGVPFSQQYLTRGDPTDDSAPARRRLAAYFSFNRFETTELAAVAAVLREEVGAQISSAAKIGADFYAVADMSEVLNSVTHVCRALGVSSPTVQYKKATDWIAFVTNVFETENLSYRVDEQGGVHRKIDAEFEHQVTSILRGLTNPKYGAIRHAFEEAHRYISSTPPDTMAAVRSMFESLEILARLMVPQTKNLNRRLMENTLKDVGLAQFNGDPVAAAALTGIFDGAALWVNAIHTYRHGQPTEIPAPPPLDFAVYVLSSGAALLRLLLDIDRNRVPSI
jgi:hypothetical protein